MEEIVWVLDHLEDLDADFLALYGIENPWEMPAARFFNLAMRSFYYQGTMQFRILREQEDQQQQGKPQQRPSREPTYGPSPSKKQGEEVKVVPLTGLLAMMPGLGEYTQVKKDESQ